MELASVTVPKREPLIVPVSDTQVGPEEADTKGFRKFIERTLEHDNVVYLGLGDYTDMGTPSNRKTIAKAMAEDGIYDTVVDALEGQAETHIETFLSLVEGTEGKWVGLLAGHHWYQVLDGSTSDTRICQALGTRFLGNAAMVRVRYATEGRGGKKTHMQAPETNIWMHHGKGGGKLPGNPLNQLADMTRGFDADVFLQGHHHRSAATKVQRLRPRWAKEDDGNHTLVDKDMILGVTGGWLKGYMEGRKRGLHPEGAYPEKGMLVPLTLGGIVIRAFPSHAVGWPTIRLEPELWSV